MAMTRRPENIYENYHAHVYFDANTFEQARTLCEQAGKIFQIPVGTMHRRPVGPHPHWSCQITFHSDHFDDLITWLEANRADLSILIHALTGNDLQDHTEFATWLGEASPLKLEVFSGSSAQSMRLDR